MSLRTAINSMCKACIHDPLDIGSAAQQIACCTSSDCPLHPVRPVTATHIPLSHLDFWGIDSGKLDGRARALITQPPHSDTPDRQIDHLQDEGPGGRAEVHPNETCSVDGQNAHLQASGGGLTSERGGCL